MVGEWSFISINNTLRQARHRQLQCALLNFPHRRLTFAFGIGFFGPGPACEASHILEKALGLMVKRRSPTRSVPMLRSPYFARAKRAPPKAARASRAQEKGDHNMGATRSMKLCKKRSQNPDKDPTLLSFYVMP